MLFFMFFKGFHIQTVECSITLGFYFSSKNREFDDHWFEEKRVGNYRQLNIINFSRQDVRYICAPVYQMDVGKRRNLFGLFL